MLQVSVDSLESAMNAVHGGADELILCSFLNDGGLTPTPGLVTDVKRLVRKQSSSYRTKVNVMIRCRGGDDFIYSEFDMITMLRDVRHFREMRVDGFVFGALTESRDIDEENAMKVLALASPKNVTFSRAFDHVREYKKAANKLVNLGFHRLLTAGLRPNVNLPGAIKNLSFLATRYSNRELSIVPTSGVNPDNVGCFINMGCNIINSSCRIPVELPKHQVNFKLGITDTSSVFVAGLEVVRELKESIMLAVEERDRDFYDDDSQ